MAKDSMFQILCSTSTWKDPGLMPNASKFIFSCSSELHDQNKCFHNSCFPELLAQHKYKHSCAPELLAQHKHQILMCSRSPLSTQNISSIVCFRVHAQHMKSYIYITYANGLCPIYQTNHYVHMQWGIRPNIPNKTSK